MLGAGVLFCSDFFHPRSAAHAGNSDDDEGQAEQLAHVEKHARFEVDLNVFGVFDEEPEGKDERKAQAEEEAGSYFLGALFVEMPAYEKEDEVGQGFVQLAGMTGQLVYSFEDEGPGHSGRCADNFAVHEVAQPDETGRNRGGDGNVVEHVPQVHVRAAVVQVEGDDEPYGSAVRGQAFVADKLPRAVGHVVYRDDHLDETVPAREEVLGLVEEAVTQSSADQDAQKAVNEKRLEVGIFYFLFFIQPLHDEVGQQQADEPAGGIPPNGERTDAEDLEIGIPKDVE